MPSTNTPIPAQLQVVAWPDPVVDELGFVPHHPYSELIATPSLGPASVLAWRRLAGTLNHHPGGFTLEVADFARALGLGTGQNAPVCRTLRRLTCFGLARFVDESTYAVRRRIPPATSSQLRRLTPDLQRLHTALLGRHDDERLGRTPQLRRGA